ncbi:MAG: endonuclease III [Paludibacteraceae bacterium]|nr:endonuclease III [Paludibacteraceae bacterium]
MTIKERYAGVIKRFQSSGVNPKAELNYSDHFSLLVAVMLSAQCTDKRVNMVTPALMKAYPTPEAMAKATPEDLQRFISSVSYPNAKAEHLVNTAKMLMTRFGGKVPCDRESLEMLPGVGRKTANVMLAVGFGLRAMPVDTHVFRVSLRTGLVKKAKTPLQCENILLENIPVTLCADMHHWLLLHGRYVCKSRNPQCQECQIKSYCKYHAKKNNKQKNKEEK